MLSYKPREAPRLEHVLGDTWCIITDTARMPLYMPSREGAVIIDTGLKLPDREGLMALLDQENIRIAAILTSHFHRDHMGNHRVLQEKYGATLYYSPLVGALLQDKEAARKLAFSAGFLILPAVLPQPGVELIRNTDEKVNAAGYDFKILDLPGHASENMGFVTPDGVAYLSDTILTPDILHAIRIPYCEDYSKDLQAKAKVLEMDYPKYILAHNGVLDDVKTLTQQNIDNMLQKVDFVESLLDCPIGLDALTAKFMHDTGAKVNELHKVSGARHNLETALAYLMEAGRVALRARDGFLEYEKV